MFFSRCNEVFRGAICPRCHKQFYICRHCDRGHVYCCRRCSSLSRFEKCRVYRQRHRQSEEGQKDHRDRERKRRRRKILGREIVVDQAYKQVVSSARVSAPMRVAAALAAIGSIGKEETNDGELFCEFCGRRSKFVYFCDGTGRWRERGRILRYPR